MTPRGPVAVAVLVAGVSTALAALPVRGALPPMYGDELELPAPHPLRLPDPTDIRGPFDATVSAAVFDGLYGLRPGGGVEPVLASAMPERDDAEVTIPLRSGVQRHDGRVLEAETVVRSLRRATNGRASGWLLAALEHEKGSLAFRAADPRTIAITTDLPTEKLARLLAAPPLSVVADRSAHRVVGTGPFRAQRPGRGLLLRSFTSAATGAPYLEEIRIHPPRQREQALRRFELGHIDACWRGRSLYGGRPVRPVTSTRRSGVFPVLLVRNRERGPLRDDETWGALARSVDRERLARIGLSPTRRLAPGLAVSRPPPGRRPDERVSLRMPVVQGNAFERRLAEALAGIVDEAGFSLVVERVSRQRKKARLRSGAWELRIATIIPPLPGRGALVGAALSTAGQPRRARRLARRGVLFEPKRAARAARQLAALVLGQRRDELHHRADLRGLRFDSLGRLGLASMHLPRQQSGGAP